LKGQRTPGIKTALALAQQLQEIIIMAIKLNKWDSAKYLKRDKECRQKP